ncbi:hypothetical protein [Arthrobacter sp. H35-D1]|uniref:hypothetical protein n=1 Tax=Arthrobacter sp. H35-D1 TaxID=3046202 RepID=UPI0024BA3AFD|nr:hypothetical protein [Arthrobacter sp. H35-D1]MDJ0312633.1 hypothetical protein [Arthrobacter sp. H35-D1]
MALSPHLASRTAAVVFLAAAFGAALSGCSITVPTGPVQPTATQGTAAPLSYVDRLKALAIEQPTEDMGSSELPQFVTDSRNIACVFTSSKAGNLNQPWEPNNFGDSANAAAPSIPVVNCQMVAYPQPLPADQGDNCSGTNVGYLGGVATLFPDKASYGGCRAGVTAVEAAFGASGTANQVMGAIPVLAPGHAMEAQGYRCAPLDDGVACANLASGTGFFIAAESYEIFGAKQ